MIIIRLIKKKDHTLDTSGEHKVSRFASFEEYSENVFTKDTDRFLSFYEYNLRCAETLRPIDNIPNSRIVKVWSEKQNGNFFRLLTEMSEEEYQQFLKKIEFKKARKNV